MKKMMCVGILAVVLAACSSSEQRASNPVQVRQPDDVNKTCPALVGEMNSINLVVSQKEDASKVTPSNIMSGNAGFGVDVKNFHLTDKAGATAEEINALYERYQYLDTVARRKNCYQ